LGFKGSARTVAKVYAFASLSGTLSRLAKVPIASRAVELIRCLDGSCGTHVEADPDKSEMNGITAFEVEEGEDPEVVYRREAAE
jgi:hypothetical protein